MSKKTQITVELSPSAYAALQSYKKEHFFTCDSVAVLSFVLRGLYNRELEKLNKE